MGKARRRTGELGWALLGLVGGTPVLGGPCLAVAGSEASLRQWAGPEASLKHVSLVSVLSDVPLAWV